MEQFKELVDQLSKESPMQVMVVHNAPHLMKTEDSTPLRASTPNARTGTPSPRPRKEIPLKK
jgi:hypothetical protein